MSAVVLHKLSGPVSALLGVAGSPVDAACHKDSPAKETGGNEAASGDERVARIQTSASEQLLQCRTGNTFSDLVPSTWTLITGRQMFRKDSNPVLHRC